MNRSMLRSFIISFLIFCLLLTPRLVETAGAAPTHAASATITVNTTVDEDNVNGNCSLREAIWAATINSAVDQCAAGAGDDTIIFSVSGTLTLSSQLSSISSLGGTVTIDATGQSITISGNNTYRIFYVDSGASLTLNQVTLTAGSPAIENFGNLSISNSTLANNGGGAISNTGSLIVENSTFAGNSRSSGGGAISNYLSGSTANVTNSTFSGNSATYGGGIYVGGGTVNVRFNTFANNSATWGSTAGGAVNNAGGTLTLYNTIVADSSSGGNCSGTISDGGYNLVWGDTTCPGTNADPKLLALADYGGHTFTFALDTGSAAIEQVPVGNNGCKVIVTTDQRGAVRGDGANRGGTACDIGAYEYNSNQTPTAITLATFAAGSGSSGMVLLLGVASALGMVIMLLQRRPKKQAAAKLHSIVAAAPSLPAAPTYTPGKTYTSPAILHEMRLETRAGSALSVDPMEDPFHIKRD